jgi:hypothetical protein
MQLELMQLDILIILLVISIVYNLCHSANENFFLCCQLTISNSPSTISLWIVCGLEPHTGVCVMDNLSSAHVARH